MPLSLPPIRLQTAFAPRLIACALSMGGGLLLAASLLGAASSSSVVSAASALAPRQAVILVTTTIQSALDAAQPGDTVLVPGGEYTESLTLNQPVSLTGVSSATVIVHALAGQRVLTVTGAAISQSVVISGLTFANGQALSGVGGGVLITGGAQPLIGNLTLTGNAALRGGGLYASAPMTLTNLRFSNNTATDRGGGLYGEGMLVLVGGAFTANQCTDITCQGGGLYAAGALDLDGVAFVGNQSWVAGGGAYAGSRAWLNQTWFEDNRALGGGLGGGGLYAAGSAMLTNTDFISNAAVLFSGGGVFAAGPLTVTGGLFERNAAGSWGGAAYAGGTLVVSGTQFITHTALLHGGAIHAAGTVTLTNAHLEDSLCTHASCQGGALYAAGSLVLAHTDVISSQSGSHGGGLYTSQSASLLGGSLRDNFCLIACAGGGLSAAGGVSVTGTSIIRNGATLFGGGVRADGAVQVEGAHFESNASAGTGAALYAGGAADVRATNFISNTSSGVFGALYANASLALSGGSFVGNACLAASCTGGGVTALGSAVVTDTVFIGNSAAGWGGGLYAGGLVLVGGQFLGNSAGDFGGGVYVHGNLTLSATTLVENSAEDGGGLYHAFGSAILVNDLFAGNTATNEGAGLHLASPGSVQILHTTLAASNSVLAGAAIHVASGTVTLTNSLVASYTVGLDLGGGAASEDYNLFAGVTINTLGGVTSGGNSQTGSAAFAAPLLGDFRLLASSAARDAGLDLGIAADYEGDPRPLGSAPDQGFDEYPPPIAVTDTHATLEDTPLLVAAPGVLANDTVPPGGFATLVAAPVSGTLTLAPDGAFTFTPVLNAFGLVTFTYQVKDAVLSAAPATVTLLITAVNDLPTISVLPDVTVTLGLPIGPFTFTVSDVETAAGDLVITADSSNPGLVPTSTLLLAGTGPTRTLTISPTPALTGTTTITLTVDDGTDQTSTNFALYLDTDLHKLFLSLIQRP